MLGLADGLAKDQVIAECIGIDNFERLKRMRLISLTASILLAAAAAKAETQTERDERRSSYIAGFSCSLVVRGQPITVRYSNGGAGRMEWQEDDIAFQWSVKEDQFCTQVIGGEKRCSDLGSETSLNEKEEFQKALGKNCF